MTAETFLLYGTHEAEAGPVRLRAGPLAADLVNGNLRTIRFGESEVLRAIAYVVRDRDWGTYEPQLSGLSVEEGERRFEVRYSAACGGPSESTLRFDAVITGRSDGTLVFDVTAWPEGDFETNRCGFCILHPIVGLAGRPVTVEHVDGSVAETKLPELIDPWQPFKDMRAITHEVRPGLFAECRMEGDTFEMEDQRNWSDASYKTYVHPLEKPWPYVLASGEEMRQAVSLAIRGTASPEASTGREHPVRLEAGGEGPALPEIAVVVYPQDVEPALLSLEELKRLGPQGLLFHFDLTSGHGLEELERFAALASGYPARTTLECVLTCEGDLDAELSGVTEMVRRAGLRLDAVAVSPSVDRQSTPPGSAWPDCPPLEEVYAAARCAFPDIRLGGGMLSYFTELNRKRAPADLIDFITHCTCPIVHAADDLSVMQTLEALPFITASARAIFGGTPYRIGPSTIAMRQNPYGSTTKDNPRRQRIAMANRDPRHDGLFGAAWTIGYAARVVGARLEQLTPSGFVGPFGVLAGDGEPAPAGEPRPIFHAVAGLARMAGLTHVAVSTTADDRVAALAGCSSAGKLTVWMANLTPAEVAVDLSALDLDAGCKVAVLDQETLAGSWEETATALPASHQVRLRPYAVARIE
ncbi:D-apionate lactonase [Chelativorans xinjiangense]|uniref:D-apionate lactonase n=1 Tax=Chelativorans xinjiangense TaxID=2681485 RepID=UPI001359D7DD|nr:hypothetical protein [Chelativorans xinjiangense]